MPVKNTVEGKKKISIPYLDSELDINSSFSVELKRKKEE